MIILGLFIIKLTIPFYSAKFINEIGFGNQIKAEE